MSETANNHLPVQPYVSQQSHQQYPVYPQPPPQMAAPPMHPGNFYYNQYMNFPPGTHPQQFGMPMFAPHMMMPPMGPPPPHMNGGYGPPPIHMNGGSPIPQYTPPATRQKKKFDPARSKSFVPSSLQKEKPSTTTTTASASETTSATTPLQSSALLASQPQSQDTQKLNGSVPTEDHKEIVAEDFKSSTPHIESSRSTSSTTEKTVDVTASSDASTTASTPSSSSTAVSFESSALIGKDEKTKESHVHILGTSEAIKEKKTEKSSALHFEPETVSIQLPVVFGSFVEAFESQRVEYGTTRQSQRAQNEQGVAEPSLKDVITLDLTTTQIETPAVVHAAPVIVPSPKTPTITPASTTTQVNGAKDATSEPKLASPITTQQQQPAVATTAVPASGWAFVASQAAKKHTPKSNTASPTISASTKREDRFVPSVSNVLEPVGVVTLRYMFDKNFLKHASQVTLPKIVPRGLVNTGNICFMSSIVQMLLYCQPFYRALHIISSKTMQTLSRESSPTPLFDALIELYGHFNIKLQDPEQQFGDAVTPTEFYKSISKNERFSHLQWGQQEDAEEFFGYLLDGLHEEFTACVKKLNDHEIKTLLSNTTDDVRSIIRANLKKFQEGEFNSSETSGRSDSMTDDGWQEVSSTHKKTAKRTVEVKPSPVRQLFGGQFRSVLTIPKSKEAQSITLDPFQQIQLDISDDSVKTLEDAFTKLSEIEEIPYKSTDGSDVLAKKQTFIDRFPEVLVVHLKRFSFVSNRRIEKLRKKIAYPHDLKIPQACISPSTRKFVSGDIRYKLTGVVYHHGMSSDGGHYTVDTLRGDEGKWIRIDDISITSLELEEVLNGGENDDVKTAYILMYQKV